MKNKGFTVVDLGNVIGFLFMVVIIGGVAYAAIHFLLKFW